MRRGMRKWMMGLVMVCLLQGCGKGEETEQMRGEVSAQTNAEHEIGSMGRYLEQGVEMPQSSFSQRYYMQRLDGGEVELMGTGLGVYVLEDEEEWEARSMPWYETYCERDAYISEIALAADGAAAVIYDPFEKKDEEDRYEPQYGYGDAQGNVKDLTWKDEENYIHQFWFGRDGRLYGYTLLGEVYEMDLEGDAHKLLFEMEGLSEYVCFTTRYMVVFGSRGVLVYDLESGVLTQEDQVLQDFVRNYVGENGGMNEGSYRVVAEAGEQEDVIYVVCSGGLYRHVIGGAVMEQVMDGSINSLGDPMMSLQGFVVLPENEFLILYQGGTLCRYVYDPQMPTVPTEQISIYSLKEDYAIRQAVSLFQKEHPEVYIRYEIGMSKEGGLTWEDAVKNLNTRLMAGKGPDLLVLDGLPADSYQERGVLADLSGIVYDMGAQTKLFSNLVDACRDEGKLWYVPVRFRLPLMVGAYESLERIGDLSSLADEVEALRAKYPQGGVTGFWTEEEVLQTLMLTSAKSWVDEQTQIVDEEKLTDFLVQARRIYQAEIAGYREEELADLQENTQEQWTSEAASQEGYYAAASASAMDIAMETQRLGVGQIHGVGSDFNIIATLRGQEEDLTYDLWQGQISSGYLPVEMVGICTESAEKELALTFFRFLYGESLQDLDLPTGFPINEDSFERLKENPQKDRMDSESAGIILVSGEDGDLLFSLDIKWSSPEDFARLKEIVKEVSATCTGDSVLEQTVCEMGVKALNGSSSIEHVVAEIVKKAAIHLAE